MKPTRFEPPTGSLEEPARRPSERLKKHSISDSLGTRRGLRKRSHLPPFSIVLTQYSGAKGVVKGVVLTRPTMAP